MNKKLKIKKEWARNLWIQSQKLHEAVPFGQGPGAIKKAVEHLGYVQIDTIYVVERAHHHILFNRIPNYQIQQLQETQSQKKSIFEYWTHALSYIPTKDYKYFQHKMQSYQLKPSPWFRSVTKQDYEKVKKQLQMGPLTIRDIKDDQLKAKQHLWGSRKPSKKALELGFYRGDFTISQRDGMLKVYDLTERHFGWNNNLPVAATENDYLNYVLQRSLRSQGIVSLDSICYLEAKIKNKMHYLLKKLVEQKKLREVIFEDDDKKIYYVKSESLEIQPALSEQTHILSPFDPLIIQRKKLHHIFEYEHIFEAYVPPQKRRYGYFCLPVLHLNKIVALLDLKTDRDSQQLIIKNWHWLSKQKSLNLKSIIEAKLHEFEKFQLDWK